jgi:hypothetical protein
LGFSRIVCELLLFSLPFLSLFLFVLVLWGVFPGVVLRFVLCFVLLGLFVLFLFFFFLLVVLFGDFVCLLGFVCPTLVSELHLLHLEEYILGS